MAVVGLRTIYVALKGPDGTTLVGNDGLSESGVFEIDTVKANGNLGSRSANISNLAGTTTKVPGNNQVVDVEVGDAAPTVAIDSNAINHTVLQKLLGREKSASGAWVQKDGATESALIIETQDRVTLKRVWFAFGRGIMTQSTQNTGTNTDTAKTPEDDNLTFTAEGYKPWKNKAFATYYEDDQDFDINKVFDEVFPGSTYDPETGKAKPSTGAGNNPSGAGTVSGGTTGDNSSASDSTHKQDSSSSDKSATGKQS